MAQGESTKATMIRRLGSEDAYSAHMAEMGKLGGKGSRGYPFAHGKLDPSETGKLGGRPKHKVKENK